MKITVKVTREGEDVVIRVVDPNNWPQISTFFYTQFEILLKRDARVYIKGSSGKIRNEHWEVSEVEGPLFIKDWKYFPENRRLPAITIKACNQLNKSSSYYILAEDGTMFYAVPEQNVLDYLTKGEVLKSTFAD